MNDEQLLRYSRQIMVPQFDVTGQEKLLGSRVLIVGMGGLGSPAAMYLAAAGIGHLVIADFDTVDLSNLQRQIAHRSNDIGRAKVDSARDTLLALNPEICVSTCAQRLQGDELLAEVQQADVVVDGSDNFTTRFAINRACVQAGTPLVSGAAIRMEGQLSVFQPAASGGPCYHCLYREGEEPRESCSETGIVAPLAGVIGSLQALEAIKVLLGLGHILDGRLLLLDAMIMEWREVKLGKDPNCPVCSG